MYENESLLEIAIELMEKKRKAHTLTSLAKEILEMKNIKYAQAKEIVAQFAMDFMLSGHFICCGEDKKGNKLWDLKSRQTHEMQDREGIYQDDFFEDDEDVKKNELKDEIFLTVDEDIEASELDEDDDYQEKDEIEEEMGYVEKEYTEEDNISLEIEEDTDDLFDDQDDEI